MSANSLLDIRGAKIPLFNLTGAYNDLLGGTLNTSLYAPWSQVVGELQAAGVNNVTLSVSLGVMRNATDSAFDPTLNFNPDLQAIRQLAALVRSKGMNITLDLFPHLANVISGDPSQAGADRPYPDQPAVWMQNFGSSILQWSRFATEIGATALVPFGDTTQHLFSDPTLTPSWLQLIAQIRQVFSGTITSNWWTPGHGDSVTRVPSVLIQQLDSLGLGLFPNLTFDDKASTEALTRAYHSDATGNDVLAFLKALYTAYGKPIWITDKAFHSFDGAAHNEGRIFNTAIPLTPDLEEQARLYDSFLLALSRESGDWLQGVSFQSFNNLDDRSDYLHRFTNGPLSESPQGKPAFQIMADWFAGLRPAAGLALTGSSQPNTLEAGLLADTLAGGAGNDVLRTYGGNDVLVGGPTQLQPTATYQIDLSLRGVVVQGTAPVVQLRTATGEILVTETVTGPFQTGISANQQPGSPTHLRFEVFDIGSPLSLVQTNWAFVDFSGTGNRFVHIESATVNGVQVDLARTVTYVAPSGYAPQPGGLDSVHGGQFAWNLSTVPAPAQMVTPTDDDLLEAGTGNDTLTGGAGNDTLHGGLGTDTALYAGALNNYRLTNVNGNAQVSNPQGPEGTDTLKDIERLRFSDTRLALDVGPTQSAGQTLLLLGAVLPGRLVLDTTKQALLGSVMSLFDQGYTLPTLAGAVMRLPVWDLLTAQASPTLNDVARYLLTNVNGTAPDAVVLATASATLNAQALTTNEGQWLAELAASTTNQIRIDLVGLVGGGVAF